MGSANRNVNGSVLVVGGGITGMQAALDLADSGFYVHLVEKSPVAFKHAWKTKSWKMGLLANTTAGLVNKDENKTLPANIWIFFCIARYSGLKSGYYDFSKAYAANFGYSTTSFNFPLRITYCHWPHATY